MDGRGRTLAVAVTAEEVKNLTSRVMWVYGTSGKMIELSPIGIDVKAVDITDLKDGKYYIADKKIKDILLEKDPEFSEQIIKATFIGKGIGGEKLYRFTRFDGKAIIPITDKNGSPGESLFVSSY